MYECVYYNKKVYYLEWFPNIGLIKQSKTHKTKKHKYTQALSTKNQERLSVPVFVRVVTVQKCAKNTRDDASSDSEPEWPNLGENLHESKTERNLSKKVRDSNFVEFLERTTTRFELVQVLEKSSCSMVSDWCKPHQNGTRHRYCHFGRGGCHYHCHYHFPVPLLPQAFHCHCGQWHSCSAWPFDSFHWGKTVSLQTSLLLLLSRLTQDCWLSICDCNTAFGDGLRLTIPNACHKYLCTY